MNSNNVKKSVNLHAAGTAPDHVAALKGIASAVNMKQLRANPRLRSPFKFGWKPKPT